MKMETQEKSKRVNESANMNSNKSGRHRPKQLFMQRHKRLLLISGIGVGVLIAIGGAIAYVAWMNSPVQVLATSFQNTLALQKLTFHMVPKDKTKGVDQLASQFSGQYDKSNGYALTASTTAQTARYKIMIDTDSVLDLANSSAYFRFGKVMSTPKTDADRGESEAVQQQLQTMIGSKWTKVQMSPGQDNNYICMASALHTLQDKPALGSKLITTLAQTDAVVVQEVSSDSNATIFAIKPKNDQVDKLVKAYADTEVYKTYAKCAALADNSAMSMSDAVRQFDVTVKVNKQAKRIESVALTDKGNQGSVAYQLTIAPAQNVTITIPKNVTTTASSSDMPFGQ